MAEYAKRTATVDARGLDEITWKVLQEVFHYHDRPCEGKADVRDQYRENVVDQPPVSPELKERDDDHLLRQHERVDNDDQNGPAERKTQKVKRIGCGGR